MDRSAESGPRLCAQFPLGFRQEGELRRRVYVCVSVGWGGNGREWKMVMKELIASSGFWNRTLAPSARGRAAHKWNIDDRGENKGKWPSCMIDMKATHLCRTCLNRQYVPPGFYGSVYTYHRFNIAEVHKYYIISFSPSIIHKGSVTVIVRAAIL